MDTQSQETPEQQQDNRTEASILHAPQPIVQFNGKSIQLKRLTMRDTLDLMEDLMAMMTAAESKYPGKDIQKLPQEELVLVMLGQMDRLFRVPARLAKLTQDELLDGDPTEASELFRVVMSSTDVMQVFSNLQDGWSKMGLQEAPANPAPMETNPSS